MSFENIVGNEKTKELLEKTIRTKNILHSYLFSGIDGIGKKIFALEFSKMILCKENTSYIEFDNNNHPDFMLIEAEEKTIKIEQIRYMNSKIYEKPIIGERKIVVIDNSDTMTKEAQNALLKTLEEPPEYVTIILITSNESKLLNTIKSRCIKVNFSRIPDKQIEEYVKSKQDISINSNMISYSAGSIGRLIKLSEYKDEYLALEEMINELEKENLIHILNNAEILYKNKDIIFDLLEYINVLLLNSKQIKKINCVKYIEETKKRLRTKQ